MSTTIVLHSPFKFIYHTSYFHTCDNSYPHSDSSLSPYYLNYINFINSSYLMHVPPFLSLSPLLPLPISHLLVSSLKINHS